MMLKIWTLAVALLLLVMPQRAFSGKWEETCGVARHGEERCAPNGRSRFEKVVGAPKMLPWVIP